MNRIATILASLALIAAPLVVGSPAAAQDWVQPPSSIELSHVEGSMSTGWYIEGHRYGIPVATTFPRIGLIRHITCSVDETGACEAAWLRFYRGFAAFRDAEQPAPVVPLVLHHHSGPVTR